MLKALRLEQVEATSLWRITASAPVPRDPATHERLEAEGFVIQSQEVSMIATEAQMRMLYHDMRLVFGEESTGPAVVPFYGR